MRLRLAVLASVLTAAAVAFAPGSAGAALAHNAGLTINASPNPIIAGDGVLIYGELRGTNIAGKTIRLYHRVSPLRQFTLIGTTTTDSFGVYEFRREEGVVYTNRSWFVAEPNGTQSRTIHERVAALVTASASTNSASTGQEILFTGHVTPNHGFERVYLQVQRSSSDQWRTLKSARLGPASNYAIAFRFRIPGTRALRVMFPGDRRNIRGASDPIPVTIQQKQVADFTIGSSSPIIGYGQQATISGVVYQPGTKNPAPNVAVTLCGHAIRQPAARSCEAAVTGGDGHYSFTVSPTQNEVYAAFTTLPPHRHSASLYEGVQDSITLAASATTVQAGQPVTFSGTVTPDKAGDVVYLERLGTDGVWHAIAVRVVSGNSTYQITRAFLVAGTHQYRVRILSDHQNVGIGSTAVSVTVVPASPGALPPAS